MKLTSVVFALAVMSIATRRIQSQPVDTAAIKSSLLAADAALSRRLATEGPEALIGVLDPKAAVLMPEQPILRAGDAARAALMKRYGAPSQYRWIAKHAVASIDGNFGCTIGVIRFTSRADTLHRERGGVYEACWQRRAGGDWRIIGLQSQDDPGGRTGLLYLADVPFTRLPHSATVARSADPVAATLDQDTRFASMAADVGGPGPAFVKFAALDAISLIAPDSARGREEIAHLFAGAAGEIALLWNPDRSFGAGSGGLAFTVGRSVRIPLKGQQIPERHGKFLTIWRENPDGTWSWIFDLGSLRRWQND